MSARESWTKRRLTWSVSPLSGSVAGGSMSPGPLRKGFTVSTAAAHELFPQRRRQAPAPRILEPSWTSGSTGTENSGRDLIGRRPLHRLIDFAASELESYQKGCRKQQG